MRMRTAGMMGLLCLGLLATASAGDWPQFRGPNASGRPQGDAHYSADIGPDKNVLWKIELPPGHSSPVILGNRIFLTGERDKKLLTIALERSTGKTLWAVEAPYKQLEEIHATASHCTPTPATDGQIVVSFFGSCGLFCYDLDGNLLWSQPMGPFKNDFGAGSSPIIVDDKVILYQDHDTGSFITAYNKNTGNVIWTVDRSEFPRNYATPIVWHVEGKKQIVIPATLRIIGYDAENGKEVWTVGGIARIVNMTPSIGDDGRLYAPCWSPGGDDTQRIEAPKFEDVLRGDTNKDGIIQLEETTDGTVKTRFTQIDRDKSGGITRDEYESMLKVFQSARNGFLAIRPGGSGDITSTHVDWRFNRGLPYCPSPVFIDGKLFMVKDGGMVTVVDAVTGKPSLERRVSGTGGYFASCVAADGKVFMLSQRGRLSIISAVEDWKQIGNADFGEDAYATPALADGKIYLRTTGHLYCLGE